eukprot:TRINITY_DN3366_c0_g1_i3.p1 TRINITY_DN3366_c0_g1~~TRINITY_DN3366_c0_g1_i3.p1  ORF type:complete len:1259 (-),score=153.23 TRINITY_DN3366_c0_g1_i3:710-4486(-)
MGETFLFDQAEVTGADSVSYTGGSLRVRIISDYHEACHRITLTRAVQSLRIHGTGVYILDKVTGTGDTSSTPSKRVERKIGVVSKGYLGSSMFKITFTEPNVTRLDVRTLVRALAFRSSDEPTVRYGQPLEVKLKCRDGLCSVVTQEICILPPGDSPVISVFSPMWTYTEYDNRKARCIAPSLALAKRLEIQSGGSIRVEFLSGHTIDDTLTLMPDCKFSIGADRQVRFRNTSIGVLKTGTLGSSRFMIEFQAPAAEDNQPRVISLKVAMSLLASIAYHHHGTSLMPGYRVIRFTVCATPGQDYVATVALKVAPLSVPPEVMAAPVVCYDGSNEATEVLAAETARKIMSKMPGEFALTSLQVSSKYIPGSDKEDQGVVSFDCPISDEDIDPDHDLVRLDSGGIIHYRNKVTAKLSGQLQTTSYIIDFGEDAPWAAVEAILRRVSYDAGVEASGCRVRLVEFSWHDSEDRELHWRQPIHVVDDQLHVFLPFTSVPYVKPGEVVPVFPEIRVSKGAGEGADSGFAGGSIRVWVSADILNRALHVSIRENDVLAIRNENQVFIYGELLGYITSTDTSDHSTVLEVTFTTGAQSIATADVVEYLLQQVSFNYRKPVQVSQRYSVRLCLRDCTGVEKTTWRNVDVAHRSPRGLILIPPPWTYNHRFGQRRLFPNFEFGSDLDAGLFTNGSLRASIDTRICQGDTIGLDVNPETSQFTLQGDVIMYQSDEGSWGPRPFGELIATGPSDLHIEFNEDSAVLTRIAVQDLIRSIYFVNPSKSPGRAARLITVTLADGKAWSQSARTSLRLAEGINGRPYIRLGSTRLTCSVAAVGQMVASQASLAGVPLGMLGIGGHLGIDLEPVSGDSRKDQIQILMTDGLLELTHKGKPSVVFENVLIGTLNVNTKSITVGFDDAKPGTMHLRVLLHHVFFTNPSSGGRGRRKLLFSLSDGGAEPEVTSKLIDVIDTRCPQDVTFTPAALPIAFSRITGASLLGGLDFGAHDKMKNAPIMGTVLSFRMLRHSATHKGHPTAEYFNFVFQPDQEVGIDDDRAIWMGSVKLGELMKPKLSEEGGPAPLRIRITCKNISPHELQTIARCVGIDKAIPVDSFVVIVALKSLDGAHSAAQRVITIPDAASRRPDNEYDEYYSEYEEEEKPDADTDGSYYETDDEIPGAHRPKGVIASVTQPQRATNGLPTSGNPKKDDAGDSSYYSYEEEVVAQQVAQPHPAVRQGMAVGGAPIPPAPHAAVANGHGDDEYEYYSDEEE